MAFPTAPTEDVVESVIVDDVNNDASPLRAYMESRFYSVFTVRRGDDVSTVQAKLDAAAAAGQQVPVVFPSGGSLYCPGLTVPAGVRLLGNDCQLITDQNAPILTLTGDGIELRDLELSGSLPAGSTGVSTMAQQIGAYYSGTAATPINRLKIKDCRFTDFYGIGVQILQGRNIKVTGSEFDQYIRGGIWLQSVDGALIHDNDLNGIGVMPSWVGFCYGVTATVSIVNGTIDDTINPRSKNIRITGNRVQNQAWECLDTHLGQNILFAHNVTSGLGSCVTAIGNDNAPDFSPLNINVIGNTHTCDVDAASTGGIALIGSKNYANTGRQLLTGSIIGNIVNGAYTDGLSASGAINLSNSIGVPVAGNTINQSKSIGFYLRNAFNANLVGNTIVDLWRSGTGPTAFYLLKDNAADSITIHSTGNIIARGGLNKPLVNSFSFGGTADPAIQVLHSNDYLSASAPAGAGNQQSHRFRTGLGTFNAETLGFYGSNGTTKPLSPGAATLSNVDQVVNSLTASLRGLGLIN